MPRRNLRSASHRPVDLTFRGLLLLLPALSLACSPAVESASGREPQGPGGDTVNTATAKQAAEGTKLATFGAGCFWCVEAVFEQLEGVISVESGYSGGNVPNPTYKQVCTGRTGHAEVCQIRYDPSKITFDELLEVFWKTHDPTTLNRQGPDVGTQYRSVIFYHDEEQKQLAAARKAQLNAAKVFRNPIVTEISPAEKFYEAEGYHQDFYSQNPRHGYCQFHIAPKVEKFRKVFREKLKRAGD